MLRNQVVALVGVLIAFIIVEPALIGLVNDVGRYAPLHGAPAGLLGVGFDDDDDFLLAPAAAGAVMLAWLTVLFTAAATLLRRRDLT